MLWATVYPWVAAKTYGPNTIVYDVDSSQRSADLPYVGRLLELGYALGTRLGGNVDVLSSVGELKDGGLVQNKGGWVYNTDLGQLAFPSHMFASHISGYELRDGFSRGGTPMIEFAFYKWSATPAPVVLVVDTAEMSSNQARPECITFGDSSDNSIAPRLFECADFNDWRIHRVPSLVRADTAKPVPISAVLFAVSPKMLLGDRLAACEAARALLPVRAEHRQSPLRKWPRLAAVISATRVNCDGRVLSVSSAAESCEMLIGSNFTTLVEAHGDRVPQASNRFGFGARDWHGNEVPAEWQALAPAPPCVSMHFSPPPSPPPTDPSPSPPPPLVPPSPSPLPLSPSPSPSPSPPPPTAPNPNPPPIPPLPSAPDLVGIFGERALLLAAAVLVMVAMVGSTLICLLGRWLSPRCVCDPRRRRRTRGQSASAIHGHGRTRSRGRKRRTEGTNRRLLAQGVGTASANLCTEETAGLCGEYLGLGQPQETAYSPCVRL